MTHDQLQSKCHLFLWNEYPHLRFLSHSNLNNLTTETSNARFKMARLKSMGIVRGVLDYEFYYQGVLHVFDFKVGRDKLSEDQKAHIKAIEGQGGKGYVIRSLEEFKEVIEGIVGEKK